MSMWEIAGIVLGITVAATVVATAIARGLRRLGVLQDPDDGEW